MKNLYKRAFQKISEKIKNKGDITSFLQNTQNNNASIYKILPTDQLRDLLKIPCPVKNIKEEQYQIIQAGKRLRASLDINEGKTCRKCPQRQECKLSFEPGYQPQDGAFNDLYNYLERLSEPQISQYSQVYGSAIIVANSLPFLLDLLKDHPELLQQINNQRDTLEQERLKRRQQSIRPLRVGENKLQTEEITQTLSPLQHYKLERNQALDKKNNLQGKKQSVGPWGDLQKLKKPNKVQTTQLEQMVKFIQSSSKKEVQDQIEFPIKNKKNNLQKMKQFQRPRNFLSSSRNFKQKKQSRYFGQGRLFKQQNQTRFQRKQRSYEPINKLSIQGKNKNKKPERKKKFQSQPKRKEGYPKIDRPIIASLQDLPRNGKMNRNKSGDDDFVRNSRSFNKSPRGYSDNKKSSRNRNSR